MIGNLLDLLLDLVKDVLEWLLTRDASFVGAVCAVVMATCAVIGLFLAFGWKKQAAWEPNRELCRQGLRWGEQMVAALDVLNCGPISTAKEWDIVVERWIDAHIQYLAVLQEASLTWDDKVLSTAYLELNKITNYLGSRFINLSQQFKNEASITKDRNLAPHIHQIREIIRPVTERFACALRRPAPETT